MKNPLRPVPVNYPEQARYKTWLDPEMTVVFSPPDAIITSTAGGIIINWSPAAEKLFGFTAGEATGMNISSLIPCDRLGEYSELVKEACAGHWISQFETERKRKDGSLVPVSLSLFAVKDFDGVSTAICCIARDSSERRRRQQENWQSLNNLLAIFENAEEGFVLIDTHCRIKAFNKRAGECMILNRNGMRAKPDNNLFDYIDENRKKEFRQIIVKVLNGESISYDKAFTGDRGDTYWFHFTLNPVRESGVITGICITGMDITNRKKAEEKAESEKRRFRGMVENSGDGAVILSADGQLLYVSPSVKRILGYSEEEAMQLNLFSIIHPDDLPIVKKGWDQILASAGIPWSGKICRIIHKNGSWRWVDATITNMTHDPSIGGIVDNFRDITDKVEADRRLRLSEERYRYLFYNSPLPMWVYDPKSLAFLEVNDAAIEKYGYSRHEFLQLTINDIRPKEDKERSGRLPDRREHQSDFAGNIWTHVTRSGRLLYADITTHVIQFEERTAILVLANDITEQKKASELLYKLYQENTNILESITDGFFTLDKNWMVTYWNKQAECLLGLRREEILGKNIWEVFPEAVPLKFYAESNKAALLSIPISFEEFFPPISTWFDVSIYPAGDVLSVYFRDITEKKLASDRIRKAKERYELLARATNDAIYEWDIRENATYWGEGFETLFGHERTEGKMPIESWTENIHPDEKEQLFAALNEAFREKKTLLTREMKFRCADGSYKTVFDKLAILYDGDLQPVKVVGAMRDITEKRKLETELRESQLRQQRAVTEATIKGQEKERRQLAIELHDNINQILATSKLYLDAGLSGGVTDKDRIRQGQHFIIQAINEIRKLSHALLPPDLDEFGLAQALEGLAGNISATGKLIIGITWSRVDERMLQTDQKMTIYRIVQEQINNIIKHADAGKVLISVSVEGEEENVVVLISDDGKGFDPSKKRNGVGLKNITSRAELFGAKVAIRSAPGYGCDLTVIFPGKQRK